MSNVFALVQGLDFDCTADNIQTRADRVGASVHRVKVGRREVRVLAYDAASAESTASAWRPEEEGLL